MTGYIIKVTYLDGVHAGYVYYHQKGGYSTELGAMHWAEDCYRTRGICEGVCKRLARINEQDWRVDKHAREWQAETGRKVRDQIHFLQSFEPVEVEVIGSYAKEVSE